MSDCIFCKIVAGELGDHDLIVYQDENVAVFPSLHQRENNLGHQLVIPAPHVGSIYELEKSLGGEVIHAVSRVARAVKKAFSADGIAIKQHNEKAGGQDVFHVHFHVIPCFENDGIFRGNNRWPNGLIERSLEDRIAQATLVREALMEKV